MSDLSCLDARPTLLVPQQVLLPGGPEQDLAVLVQAEEIADVGPWTAAARAPGIRRSPCLTGCSCPASSTPTTISTQTFGSCSSSENPRRDLPQGLGADGQSLYSEAIQVATPARSLELDAGRLHDGGGCGHLSPPSTWRPSPTLHAGTSACAAYSASTGNDVAGGEGMAHHPERGAGAGQVTPRPLGPACARASLPGDLDPQVASYWNPLRRLDARARRGLFPDPPQRTPCGGRTVARDDRNVPAASGAASR